MLFWLWMGCTADPSTNKSSDNNDTAPIQDSGRDTGVLEGDAALCPTHVTLDPGEPVVFRSEDDREWSKLTGMFIRRWEGGWRTWTKAKTDGDAFAIVRVFDSKDGVDWVLQEDCGVDLARWVASVGTASVMQRDNRWWMWLRVDDAEVHQRVGAAVSDDGCSFKMYPEYFGGEEPWAEDALMAPHVVRGPDQQLWMYYRGSPHVNQRDSAIGLATSTDGRDWTPWPENPIFPASEDGWDSSLVAGPHVWREEDHWRMLYSGHDREVKSDWESQAVGTGKRIGLAVSRDGVQWTRCSPEPLFERGIKDDNPFLAELDGQRWLYYRTTDEEDATGGEIWRTAWPH